MSKQPMKRVHDGAFLVNETAANDPICQQVMASYLEELKRETARRQAIRECREAESDFPSWGPAMGQWGHWNISDRD